MRGFRSMSLAPRTACLLSLGVLMTALAACGSAGGATGGPAPDTSAASAPVESTPSASTSMPSDVPTAGMPTSTGPGKPAASPMIPPPADSTVVVVTRSGGIAGVRDSVVVRDNGQWTLSRKSGSPRQGTMSRADATALLGLVGSGALAGESSPGSGKGGACADAFVWSITLDGQSRYVNTDCGGRSHPTFNKVLTLLHRTTAF